MEEERQTVTLLIVLKRLYDVSVERNTVEPQVDTDTNDHAFNQPKKQIPLRTSQGIRRPGCQMITFTYKSVTSILAKPMIRTPLRSDNLFSS